MEDSASMTSGSGSDGDNELTCNESIVSISDEGIAVILKTRRTCFIFAFSSQREIEVAIITDFKFDWL
jgi:hypothetical protein